MDGSALTLLFDTALPFLSPLGLGPKLPGLMGDCYRKREYWTVKLREMVDYFLKHCTEDDIFLLTPLVKGTDAFLERKLSTNELVPAISTIKMTRTCHLCERGLSTRIKLQRRVNSMQKREAPEEGPTFKFFSTSRINPSLPNKIYEKHWFTFSPASLSNSACAFLTEATELQSFINILHTSAYFGMSAPPK